DLMLAMVRGQIKIQQMAFMLIAITLLFAFVGLFIISVKTSGLSERANILGEENAMLLVDKLADTPEFSCGDLYSGKSNCIDADKVMILKDSEEYKGFWGVNEIKIKRIYPVLNGEVKCTENNYPDCNVIEVYSDGSENWNYKSNFVSLCRIEQLEDKVYDKCEIAKLFVSWEVQQ
ncbi:hypothetical protein K8R47_01445, partial [archaeon]|nr:hypothetical protein [archaeon]